MLETFCKTDIGLNRSQNEDVCAANRELNFFMVADGMGGAAVGDVASRLFLAATRDIFSSSKQTSPQPERSGKHLEGTETPTGEEEGLAAVKDRVYRCFEEANIRIQAHVEKIPAHQGMGCTAELLTFWNRHYVIGHVGDSRTYVYSPAKSLRQLTKDHSLVQAQVDSGSMLKSQAETSRLKNVLTKAVGIMPRQEMDLISGLALPGDIFLLCSDGLYNMVSDKEIEEVLAFDGPLDLKADILINMANDAGGRDNISVTLVTVAK